MLIFAYSYKLISATEVPPLIGGFSSFSMLLGAAAQEHTKIL